MSESVLPATVARAEQPSKPMTPLQEFWHYFSENRGAVWGLRIVVAIILMAIFADYIVPHDPTQQYRGQELKPPGWVSGEDFFQWMGQWTRLPPPAYDSGGSWEFVLGTDPTGRDMLSRLIKGAQYSMLIGCIVVSISISVGVSLGLAAAFAPRFIATMILRLMDIILAFPSLLLALVLVALFQKPSLDNAMIAIAIVLLPHFVRLTRASALGELQRDYVTASRVAGASIWRLMFITVLPNCLGPMIVQATLSFSTAVLDAAALGFLGMGAQPPTPEWGTMLADAREFIATDKWWVVTLPGLMILISVLAFNLMGDGLRDAFDPKLKRS